MLCFLGYDESNETETSHNRSDDFDLENVYRTTASFLCSIGVPPRGTCFLDFIDLVHELNPRITLKPGKFELLYFEIYEQQKTKMKEMFRNYNGKITLSIDLLDYMCVTAHYIDDDWKKKNWILFYRSVCTPGYPDLNESILKCISDFEIETKIFAITTSTRDDFREAFEVVKDSIQQKKKVAIDGQLFHVICCADIFSLMVQNAFKKLDGTLGKLRQLYSPGRSKPVWNITLGFIETVLMLEAKGEYSNPNEEHLVGFEIPSAEEWDKVRGVYKLVCVISKVAYVMFEIKHATANIYLHLLREVQETLTLETTNSDKFIAALAKRMVKTINKYCKDMFMVLAMTAVMDPRLKMKYIEFSCSEGGGSSSSEAASILEAIRKLYADYVIGNYVEEESFNSDSSSDSEESLEEEIVRKDLEKCMGYYNEFGLFNKYRLLVQSDTHGPVKSELDSYLEEPALAWKQDFSSISWWKASSSKYPTLSKMARDLLAIQMTVAKSYDNYYTKPREVDARIHSTKPDLMNAIMCAKSWMRTALQKEN